jgi:hypothetical protein
MIYDRPAPDDRPYYRPAYQSQYAPERPAYKPAYKPFDTLAEGKLVLEYKTFLFSLRENQRGRVLRISEVANGRFNTIMIPAAGLDDIMQILNEMVTANGGIPASPDSETAAEPRVSDSHPAPIAAEVETKIAKTETKALKAEIEVAKVEAKAPEVETKVAKVKTKVAKVAKVVKAPKVAKTTKTTKATKATKAKPAKIETEG